MDIMDIFALAIILSLVVGLINGIVIVLQSRVTYITLIVAIPGICGSIVVGFAMFLSWFIYWLVEKLEKSKLNKTLWRF